MSAVFTSLAALVKSGDRIVAARALFGSSLVIFDELFAKWGVRTDYVDGHVLEQWEAALATPATVVFFETPSNPMQDIVDVRAVCDLAHRAGALVVLDNVFATPVLQRPLEQGADIVVYSATKHIDGQGRVLGGAILGPKDYISGPVRTLIRNTGPSLSPFNAWVLLKGLETLSLRVRHQSASAHRLAGWLEGHPGVAQVRYPFLESHPQYELARAQMEAGGTVVTIATSRCPTARHPRSPSGSPSASSTRCGSSTSRTTWVTRSRWSRTRRRRRTASWAWPGARRSGSRSRRSGYRSASRTSAT